MFRIVSITGFMVVFGGIVLHCMFSLPKFDALFGTERRWRILDALRILLYLGKQFLPGQKPSLNSISRKLIYLLALFSLLILSVTGFYQPLVHGKSISGYWMMLHSTFSPVFAVCLAALAAMWSRNCLLDKNYWPWLQKLLRRQAPNRAAVEKYELVLKLAFWLIILLALSVILSIVSSMFPVFGTAGLKFLLNVHRYSALLLVLLAIVHTYLMARTRINKSRTEIM